MFERYTEKARRTVFFARYEASQYGSPEITTEHLLLGLLREDRGVFQTILPGTDQIEAIEQEVRSRESRHAKEKLSTQVDLPLSNPGKRALAYAAEEAVRLADRHIGTEHLVMGLLRESSCDAAEILRKHGVRLEKLHETAQEPAKQHKMSLNRSREMTGSAPGSDTVLEFVEASARTQVAVMVPPLAIPTLGEEVVFEESGLVRSYRVVNVAYVFQNSGGSRKLARIVITLETIETDPESF